MDDYKSLYYKLFNGIGDIIEDLKKLQAEAEEIFISQGEKENEKTEN